MKSIEIRSAHCTDDILKVSIRFDNELTPEFVRELYLEIKQVIQPQYRALLIDISDVMLLELTDNVLQFVLEHLTLRHYSYGIAISSESRISRNLLNTVLLRSQPAVPIRVFHDNERGLDWLKLKTGMNQ